MGTDIRFLQKELAGGVGAATDSINRPLRDLLTALGASPGTGATFNWKPHLAGSVLNIRTDYGANEEEDAYAPIQAAFDDQASASSVNGFKAVYVPPGRYVCSAPPRVHAMAPVIIGPGQGYNAAGYAPARIDVRSACGPALYVQGDGATVSGLTTSLASGNGQAYRIIDTSRWLNLRDCEGLDLHGLGAFTIRCFFQSTDGSGGNNRAICSSSGAHLPNDTPSSAFFFGRSAAGKFTATVVLSGGTVGLEGSSSVIDGVTHVLEFNYDGSTVRLFVDGTAEASSAGTGTVVQGKSEDVILGPSCSWAPERSLSGPLVVCTIDSFEVADVARNVVNYSKPTAKFVKDSHTKILLNNTATLGALLQVDTASGTGWLYQRDNAYGTGLSNTSGLRILGGLTISSNSRPLQGLLLAGSVLGTAIDDLNVLFCREGIRATNGGFYQFTLTRPYVNCGSNVSRYGIVGGSLFALQMVLNGWIQGSQVLYCGDGSTTSLHNTFLQMDSRTVIGGLFTNAGAGSENTFSLDNCNWNTEPGVSADYRAAIGMEGALTQVLGKGGALETGNDAPHIIMDSMGGGEWVGGDFRKAGSPPAVVHVQGDLPVRPFEFRGSDQSAGFQDWCDTAGAVTASFLGRKALAFSATPTFDFSKASQWTLAQLTDNVTAQTWENAGDGQEIVVRYIQHASAAKTVAPPSNVIGWTAISATLGSISEFRGSFDQGLDKFVGSMFAGLT